jgi:hypothetical protein
MGAHQLDLGGKVMEIVTLGIDLAKNIFALQCLRDKSGHTGTATERPTGEIQNHATPGIHMDEALRGFIAERSVDLIVRHHGDDRFGFVGAAWVAHHSFQRA